MIEHRIDNEEGVLNTFIITCCDDLLIERCLKTLTETIDRKQHRIIFIEGPSVEDRPIMYDLVKSYVDVYIRTETNYGFSKSCNLGMSMVYTPYFTIVHDDCWFVHKGWWDECREALELDADKIMIQPSQPFRRIPRTELIEFPTEEQYQELKKHARTGGFAEIYCALFKREWIDLIGYFDEGIYPVGPEDMDWYRLALAVDKHTGVTNAAWVHHLGVGRAENKHGGPRNDRNKTINFVEKWGGDSNSKQVYSGLTTGEKIIPTIPNQIKQL